MGDLNVAFLADFTARPAIERQDASCPESVSGLELARFLKMSDRRVRQLCDLGMPKAKRGRYNLRECVGWYVLYLRGVNSRACHEAVRRANQIKERRWGFQADILELQLAKLTARFASKRECFEAFEDEIRNIERMVKRLPAWIAHELKASPDEHGLIKRVVETEWEKQVASHSRVFPVRHKARLKNSVKYRAASHI